MIFREIFVSTTPKHRAQARAQAKNSENSIFPTLRLVCSPMWFWEPLSRACGNYVKMSILRLRFWLLDFEIRILKFKIWNLNFEFK